MRIGILGSRGYPSTYGGFETLVRQLIPVLSGLGHEVVVYGRTGIPAGPVAEVANVESVITWGVDRKTASTLTYGLGAALDARRRRLDVALVLNPANGYYLPLLRSRSIPTVVNVDGIEWQRAKWNALGKAVFKLGARACARYADVLVADSRAIQTFWQSTFHVPSVFIPYGGDTDLEVGDEALVTHGLRHRTYVLAVARLVPENNIDLFLDAVALLPAEIPVVLVGTAGYDSPLEAKVAAVFADRPNAQWLGHVSDQRLLRSLWAHAGAYFHGHTVGGTNPSLLEALGAGAPVLAFDTVYNREVVGRPELLVGSDPHALANRFTDLLADPRQQQELSAFGSTIVADRYRWSEVCAAYLETLQLAATKSARRHS